MGVISDHVVIPADLEPGDYALSWRWDCEETAQVCVCVRARARVRACVRACVRVRVRSCAVSLCAMGHRRCRRRRRRRRLFTSTGIIVLFRFG